MARRIRSAREWRFSCRRPARKYYLPVDADVAPTLPGGVTDDRCHLSPPASRRVTGSRGCIPLRGTGATPLLGNVRGRGAKPLLSPGSRGRSPRKLLKREASDSDFGITCYTNLTNWIFSATMESRKEAKFDGERTKIYRCRDGSYGCSL